MQNVTVQYRNHHGLSVAFPLCETGKIYAAISGAAHFTKPVLEHMKRLGISFDVVQEVRAI